MREPRSYMKVPGQFGKTEDVQWVSGVSEADLAGADVQHRCAIAMRKGIKRRYGSAKAYCEKTGQSYQRLVNVLRGAAAINIHDIGSAVAYLDISVSFVEQFDRFNNRGQVVAGSTFLRDAYGAFYTPDSVAAEMVKRLGLKSGDTVLEPSFGDGSFIRALREHEVGSDITITGCEIDQPACKLVASEGLLSSSEIFDDSFFKLSLEEKFNHAIGNPPFVRLRSLKGSEVDDIRSIVSKITGEVLGKDSSEWLPFLIKAVAHLKDGGNLFFVLPFDFTYVKYARASWGFLGRMFDGLEVIRSKERIFTDILQDVILLFASGKGGSTNHVRYRCYEQRANLFSDNTFIDATIPIKRLVEGDRAFQEAFVPGEVLSAFRNSRALTRTKNEAVLHIGYVCGNKDYFHPSPQTIQSYGLPSGSLKRTVISSRQIGKEGLRTSDMESNSVLWLPSDDLTKAEQAYIEYGEKMGVNLGYKCKVRNPWWKVPGAVAPDAIMTVFGDTPRVLLNDAGLTVSNSILGCHLREGVAPEQFCASWYSTATLLSVELEVHSLGGGVLVAVPQEAGKVFKLASQYADKADLLAIDKHLRQGNLAGAYTVSDEVLEKELGSDVVASMRECINTLRVWRVR